MRTLQSVPHWQKAILILAGIVFVLVAGLIIVLALRWPFTESRVLESIRENWLGSVKAARFHSTILPHPGCTIEDLVLELPSRRSKKPVRATFKAVEMRALYADLLLRPGHLSSLIAEGLRVEIPVYSSTASSAPEERNSSQAGSNTSTTLGKVETHDAVLVVNRSGEKKPLTFAIHRLLMWPVRPNVPISFEAELTNAEPPGEIQLNGKLGPVRARKAGELPMSGSYTFEKADLGVFSGIAGILSSNGTFGGQLKQLKVQGTFEIPAFQVTRSHHDVDLSATFNAVVDAIHGDTTLQNVDASFLRTKVHAQGGVASMGKPGKTTDVNLTVQKGRIQDVLDLFVSEKTPPIDGVTDLETHIVILPGETPFLKKVAMDGHFSIADAILTNQSREQQIDDLSKRASGDKKDPATGRVTGRVESKVHLRRGVAQFSPVTFEIPGASVAMTGTFNLLNEQIDFHGNAKTAATLSEQSQGFKSALLKSLDWIFKRKDAGAEVPVEMTGTYDNPHFGLDLTGKK